MAGGLRPLTQAQADAITQLLLRTPLDRPIALEFPDMQMRIHVAEVSEPESKAVWKGMQTSVFGPVARYG